MEIIKAENIIIAQYDQFFGYDAVVENAYYTDLALYFEVEISIENFGFERDGNTHHEDWARAFHRSVKIVVTAKHEVFVKVGDGDWENTSNHSSCWRSDGLRVIWETMHEGWKYCWEHVPEEHQNSPAEMHRFCTINGGCFSKGAVRFMRVKTARKEGDHYRRVLTEMRPVKFTVQIEE